MIIEHCNYISPSKAQGPHPLRKDPWKGIEWWLKASKPPDGCCPWALAIPPLAAWVIMKLNGNNCNSKKSPLFRKWTAWIVGFGPVSSLPFLRVIIDASARRFQAHKLYLRVAAARRWAIHRYNVLHSPRANDAARLNEIDRMLQQVRRYRTLNVLSFPLSPSLLRRSETTEANYELSIFFKELSEVTDQHVFSDLQSADMRAGYWLNEDPPLSTILGFVGTFSWLRLTPQVQRRTQINLFLTHRETITSALSPIFKIFFYWQHIWNMTSHCMASWPEAFIVSIWQHISAQGFYFIFIIVPYTCSLT